MLSLSGYGRDGPRANYLAYGVTVASYLGLASAWGYAHGTLSDYIAGVTGALATVAALGQARSDGTPAYLDVAQVDAVPPMLAELYASPLNTGVDPVRVLNRSPGSWLSGVFPSRGYDQWLAVDIEDGSDWETLCGVLERPDLQATERDHASALEAPVVGGARRSGCRGAVRTPPCTICSGPGSPPGWCRTWRTSGGIRSSGPGVSWTRCGSRISDTSPTRGPPSAGPSRRVEPRCRRPVWVSTRGTSCGVGSAHQTMSSSPWEEGGAIFSAD